jgi:hypothetical protein
MNDPRARQDEPDLASGAIVGAFVFPHFWEDALRANSKLAHLIDCGVNAIMMESDSYELPVFRAYRRADQGRITSWREMSLA